MRQKSFYRFILYSESTAFISRSVQESLKSGQIKNYANLSSAPSKAWLATEKKKFVFNSDVKAFVDPAFFEMYY